MPSYRRLPRAVREQDILDAAVTVFSQRGFHVASVDEIAELAGISKPMVYVYVGTKEELFVAAVRREGLRLMEALASAAADIAASPEKSTSAGRGRTAQERLGAGLTAFFGFVAAHRDGWTVLYRQARGQDPFAEVIASLRAQMVELIVGLLTAAARGPVDPADLLTLALVVVGAAEELADRIATDQDPDPAILAARLTRILWLGAGPLLHHPRPS